MELARLLEIFLYAIPAIITGLVAYYFFREHTKNEDDRRKFMLHKNLQKESLSIKLQAYERMTLFLERINPNKLLVRVSPTSSEKDAYESLLIATIEQEYEHNLTQQIYLSDQCWNIIAAAKNATIQIIRKAGLLKKTDSADKLREVILTEMMEKRAPSDAALAYIKEEIRELW